MKKIRIGKRMLYISLFFAFICVLAGTFLYERSSVSSDTGQDDILAVNGAPDKNTDSSEDAEMESENMKEEVIAEFVCKRLQAVDFTIKEYPIDKEIYTEEMDREYREVFLQVLLNQTLIQNEDGQEIYFADIDPKEMSDADYMTVIKELFVYCYFDFDGDGFPELIADPCGAYVRFGGPRILKYDRNSKKVYVDGYRFMKYRPLCAGKFYYEDRGGASAIRYGYQEIDSKGNVVEEVTFQLVHLVYEYPERYFINSIGEFEHLEVELDKDSWDEMLHDFFKAKDNAVKGITYDELFSDMEHP